LAEIAADTLAGKALADSPASLDSGL